MRSVLIRVAFLYAVVTIFTRKGIRSNDATTIMRCVLRVCKITNPNDNKQWNHPLLASYFCSK